MTSERRRTNPTFLGVIALAVLCGGIVAADDGPSVAEEDDALLERLVEESLDPTEPGGDPGSLAGTIDRMRQAGRRIGDDADTGEETRRLQRRAVDDLDRLLALARSRQRRSSSSSSPPPQPMPREQPEREPGEPEPMPNEGDEPMPVPGDPRPTPNGTDSQPGDDDPAESTDRRDEGEDREVSLAERRRLVKDVWGHLPPQQREELLNARSDEPLPKYTDLVSAYFRALAERSRKRD